MLIQKPDVECADSKVSMDNISRNKVSALE